MVLLMFEMLLVMALVAVVVWCRCRWGWSSGGNCCGFGIDIVVVDDGAVSGPVGSGINVGVGCAGDDGVVG